jgi:toxin HigB-1
VSIYSVILNNKVKSSLKKMPIYISIKLFEWINAVSHDGLLEIKKQPGYHDEPLKGKRQGQRSIRLSMAYRAIYELSENGKMKIIEIVEVNKHDY